jgi:imidazolonepropionase
MPMSKNPMSVSIWQIETHRTRYRLFEQAIQDVELPLSRKKVDLIILHAKQLVTARGHSHSPAVGLEMEDLEILEDGAVAVDHETIVAVGKTGEVSDEYSATVDIDVSNRIVTPGFIDPHTHLVFAGSRETELELKIKGAGYLEILQSGGGILRTVHDTRAASKDQLLETCKKRTENILLHGTTTIEAKSGYGLTLEDEIKSLEVIRQLDEQGPLDLVPTFLGAHAIPSEYQTKTREYVTQVCDNWIPQVARKGLARFCDVFCESGVFEITDSRRILESGKRVGLLPKIHADELSPLGGAELAAEVGAVSADHLLYASDDGLEHMKRAGVIATLLPAAPLTLMLERYPDARKIIARGVPVALGSDLSPSCWLENQQLIIALTCYKLKMTPAEAMVAATINAAHAIRKAHEIGSIEVGKKADLTVFEIPDFRFLGYRFGTNLVDRVIKNGKVVVENGRLMT